MIRGLQGTYEISSVVGESVKSFIPKPLPPSPALNISFPLQQKLDKAIYALGKLDSVSHLLPDVNLFLYTFVRKEAVLSSMIEGTQSSLSDLLLFELDEIADKVPFADVEEVSNYVKALNYGLKRLEEGFPMSLRLLKEIHHVLLLKGRGCSKNPGEFRRSQNWIGGTRPGNAIFVPPSPEKAMECLNQLELFFYDETIPLLIKVALIHVQFETIHPFLDGNGRIGRLLIVLLLCNGGLLKHPLLYLSYYFKSNRTQYYNLLNSTRETGDWELWLDFFLEGVYETASQSFDMIVKIRNQINEDREKIRTLGRIQRSVEKVHSILLIHPIADIAKIKELSGLTFTTISSAIKQLIQLNIVNEITSKKRNRIFCYSNYLEHLSK